MTEPTIHRDGLKNLARAVLFQAAMDLTGKRIGRHVKKPKKGHECGCWVCARKSAREFLFGRNKESLRIWLTVAGIGDAGVDAIHNLAERGVLEAIWRRTA